MHLLVYLYKVETLAFPFKGFIDQVKFIIFATIVFTSILFFGTIFLFIILRTGIAIINLLVPMAYASNHELHVDHVINVNLFDPIMDRLYSNVDGIIMSFPDSPLNTFEKLVIFKGVRQVMFTNRRGNVAYGAFIPWHSPRPYEGFFTESVMRANRIFVKVKIKEMVNTTLIYNGTVLTVSILGSIPIDVPQAALFDASVKEHFARSFEEWRIKTTTPDPNPRPYPGIENFPSMEYIDWDRIQSVPWKGNKLGYLNRGN